MKKIILDMNASKASSRRTTSNTTNQDAESGGSGGGGSRGTGGAGGNSSRSAAGSRSTSGNRSSGNRSGGASSGGGAQGRGGGRGGRGAGRGGGRGEGARPYSGSISSMGDIYFDSNLLSERDILPQSLQGVLCPKWMCVGLSCPKRYNQCVGHIKLDMMRRADEKEALVKHVVETEGLWFNEASVHTLTEPAQVAKLGGPDGPRGTN